MLNCHIWVDIQGGCGPQQIVPTWMERFERGRVPVADQQLHARDLRHIIGDSPHRPVRAI